MRRGTVHVVLPVADHDGRREVDADLAEPAAADGLLAEIAAAELPIDLLVNNAGYGARGAFAELGREEQLGIVDLNCRALVALAHGVLPQMMARRSGGILNIASTAAFQPVPFMATYAATKAFGMSFAESLSLEVRDAGVKVSVVSPGSVRTGFSGRGSSGRQKPADGGPGPGPDWQLLPEDVAEAVAYAVATPPGVLVHRIEVRALSPKRARG